MNDQWLRDLYDVVLAGSRTQPRKLRDAILMAHMRDVADGRVFKREHLGLLRIYRNNVSPDPQHLIDAATAYEKEVSHVPNV